MCRSIRDDHMMRLRDTKMNANLAKAERLLPWRVSAMEFPDQAADLLVVAAPFHFPVGRHLRCP